MMAGIMMRLMVQVGALLVALIVCPVIWWHDGGAKAATLLFLLYMVGNAFAPSSEEVKAFEKFTKSK